MKFIADCHLGKIAKYLRIFGFDTLYFQSIDDDDIVTIAKEQNRLVLTSDKELYQRVKHLNGMYIQHADFLKQLKDIFNHYKLYDKCKPLSRCIECNGTVKAVDKDEIECILKPKTSKYFDYFEKCEVCSKVYWHGDHYKNMSKFVNDFLNKKI